MNRKMGWKVFGILGFIFSPMGLLFLIIGLAVGQSKNTHWEGNSDPAVFTAIFCGIGGLSCSWACASWRLMSAGGICCAGHTTAETVWTRRSWVW